MTERLEKLLIKVRAQEIKMSPEQAEYQRRSFVYGNTKIENEYVTEELVNDVGDKLNEQERPQQ